VAKFRELRQTVRAFLPTPWVEQIDLLLHSRRRLTIYKTYRSHVIQKCGLEIGGPSEIFRTVLPVYRDVRSLDGLNFAPNTIWEGEIRAGRSYRYHGRRLGHQFISEATDLSGIPDDTYEFILSSNCLEHVANPLKALLEWKRVLKSDGILIIALPNKCSNFDHRRSITDFQHIVDDAKRCVGEDDLTHLDEIQSLHDLARDVAAGDAEQFRARSLNNYKNRTLHHHVFDDVLIRKILEYVGFRVVDVTPTHLDFFALATKTGG
jgi:SAM-dependent methyltransferase